MVEPCRSIHLDGHSGDAVRKKEGMMPRLPDLEAWAIFAKVAEKRSFSQAANELGLAKTTVSKAITRLEERMRSTLLHRTTRKLSLTETGRLSLERALRILADGTAIEADILEEAAVPRGIVRLACTSGFGLHSLASVLPQFMRAYPDILVDLSLTEDPVDVISGGFDVAIRIGQGVDSSLRTSRLFSFRRPLVAAPALVEAIGAPRRPEDLTRFPAIVPTHVPWGGDWEFAKAGNAQVTVRVKSAFRVNNAAAMVPATVAGLGVTLIPEYFVWRELQDGSLVELLPDWTAPAAPIYLVTPPGQARPARVRVLLDFLRGHFATRPWAQGIEH
jgi:DNA-binding transcriptional LysR family regulator